MKTDFSQKLVVKFGETVRLNEISPDEKFGISSSDEIADELEKNTKRLVELQYKLYAEKRQSLLIILQAMDAGGKDGVINHVLAPLNPQGCRVQSFKTPTSLELEHDFLWRIHQAAPRKGEIVIFNRSHYEDVLIARVHNLVPQQEWSKRYQFINQFEDLLASCGTRIVKFFLHISKDEQLKRFQQRLEDPQKQWKISEGDYQERQYWDEYMHAFEATFEKCSPSSAPWYIIPSNRKYIRNLAVSQILVDTLQDMNISLPPVTVDLDKIRAMAAAEEKK